MQKSYIYTICSPDKQYAYAGISSNVENRVASHIAGKGCSWTRDNNITILMESYPAINRWDENVATLQLMAEYGVDCVRGGYFVMPDLDYPMSERRIVVGLLRSMHDLCVNCGEDGHYANQCENSHNDEYILRKEDNELTCNYGERDNWVDAISYVISMMTSSLDEVERFTTPRKVIHAILRHASQG